MRLSPKQKRYWNEANCRWNVKYGATRSGKTYLDYFIIPRRLLAREGRPGLAVLLGNTRGTLERNVLAPMREIYGAQISSWLHHRAAPSDQPHHLPHRRIGGQGFQAQQPHRAHLQAGRARAGGGA